MLGFDALKVSAFLSGAGAQERKISRIKIAEISFIGLVLIHFLKLV
jgi:hypothetical protein